MVHLPQSALDYYFVDFWKNPMKISAYTYIVHKFWLELQNTNATFSIDVISFLKISSSTFLRLVETHPYSISVGKTPASSLPVASSKMKLPTQLH